MLCYDVYKNGERICRAGIGEEGVLTVILSWVSNEAKGVRRLPRYRSNLHIGGLYQPEPEVNAHVRWTEPVINIGDEVIVRVVEAPTADEPISTQIDDPDYINQREREYYEVLKQKYEPTRSSSSARKKRPPRGRKKKS